MSKGNDIIGARRVISEEKIMSKHRVTFLPDQKGAEVEEGITLLEAAEQAGVYINSLCGGQGLCGECRLQVVNGNSKADKYSVGFFSADEIMKGYVLACQTRVENDLEVLIPIKSRLEMEKIITEGFPSPMVSLGKSPSIRYHTTRCLFLTHWFANYILNFPHQL